MISRALFQPELFYDMKFSGHAYEFKTQRK